MKQNELDCRDTAPLRPFNWSENQENVQEHAKIFYNYPSISGVNFSKDKTNTLSRYDSDRISIMVSIYRFGVDWARYM